MVFIRFNPDNVKYGDSYKNSNPDWRRRAEVLKKLLELYLMPVIQLTDLMTIHRICYDGCDQQSLLATTKASWDAGEFKEHVVSFSL